MTLSLVDSSVVRLKEDFCSQFENFSVLILDWFERHLSWTWFSYHSQIFFFKGPRSPELLRTHNCKARNVFDNGVRWFPNLNLKDHKFFLTKQKCCPVHLVIESQKKSWLAMVILVKQEMLSNDNIIFD